MKYYDGMGNEVTNYVEDLEQNVIKLKNRVRELELLLTTPEKVDEKVEVVEPEALVIVEEKPKRKRRKKVNANPK